MPTPTELERPPAGRSTSRRSAIPRRVPPLVIAAVAITMVLLIPSPEFVPRITLQNPTAFDLAVEVSAGPRSGWMPIGTAERGRATDVEEIYDIGESWTFRFGAQARRSDTVTLTRAELEGADWKLRIPESVGTDLRDRGAPPQAPG
jgi:hypothetical protein